MPISRSSAGCNAAAPKNIMNRNKHVSPIGTVVLCLLILLSCLLCGCENKLLVPTGGYDYRMTSAVDGAILGYPIPRKGSNPYRYTLPLAQKGMPTAFFYDADQMEYHPMAIHTVAIALPLETLSVPCVVTEEGRTFFACASDNTEVAQGDIGDMAVVLSGGILYFADDAEVLPIAENVRTVWRVHTERRCLLFSGTDGVLYEYRDDEGENAVVRISADDPVAEAWYVYGSDLHTIVYKTLTSDGAVWYCTEDGAPPVPAILPSLEPGASLVFVRDTACVFAGADDCSYFYDIRSGNVIDMDMGGLYRFPKNTDVDTLTVSPDGRFVYVYDIDFIYRLDLETGDLDLAYNEALIFEGSCVLSSMTVVTDEIILLSQAENEYTEFVPTITVAVFEENIPEVRHEDEKIDLDTHAWETDS